MDCSFDLEKTTERPIPGNIEVQNVNSSESYCGGFKRIKIVRRDISIEHVDGRKFDHKEIEQPIDVKYSPSLCVMVAIVPLFGAVPNEKDRKDAMYVKDKYFLAPFLDAADPKGAPHTPFPETTPNHAHSVNELKQLCNSF